MGVNNDIKRGGIVNAIQHKVELLIADHQRVSEHNKELVALCQQQADQKRILQQQVAQLKKELAQTTILTSIPGASYRGGNPEGANTEGGNTEGANTEGGNPRGASEMDEKGGDERGEEKGVDEKRRSEEQVKSAKAYINTLLREVDECIALVSMTLEQSENISGNEENERRE